MTRRWRVTVVALGVLLALSASGPVLAESQAGQLAGTEDPLPADLRAWVEDHGPLQVGWAAEEASPLATGDLDTGPTGGYGVELWDLAALQLGIEVEHRFLPSLTELDAAFVEGTIDVVGAASDRPALAAAGAQAPPLAVVPVVFLAPTDQGIGGLAGRTATTLPGTRLDQLLAEQFPEVEYVETATVTEGVDAVVAGDVDLYFGPLALVGSLLRQRDVALAPVGPATNPTPIGPWAAPGSRQLELATAAMETLTPAQQRVIHVKWTGFDLTDPADGVALPPWLGWALVGLLGVLVLLGVFTLILRRRVRAATAELREVNEGLEDVVEERTEELLERERQLQRSNAALQRFASVAAHDLSGPLAAIKGLVEVARTMDLDEAERAAVLGSVQNSAVQLLQMVDAMLDDASSVAAGPDQMTGAEIEQFLVDVVGPSVDAVDGRLEVEAPAGRITADGEVLRRAAINLGDNAVKYAANGDGLLLRVAVVPLDDAWQLLVEDDGPGIPTEDRERVFERGSRLTREQRGLGLGLSVLRDVVIGAGGEIHVEDADLGGARFVVTLPRTSPEGDEP